MYSKTKALLNEVRNKENLKEVFENGFSNGSIRSFEKNKELMQKLKNVNVLFNASDEGILSLEEIFKRDYNLLDIGITTLYLSFCFDEFRIVEGDFMVLSNTVYSPFGRHSWIETNESIFDVALMIEINKEVAYDQLGYFPIQFRDWERLNKDSKYIAKKKFANKKIRCAMAKKREVEYLKSSFI